MPGFSCLYPVDHAAARLRREFDLRLDVAGIGARRMLPSISRHHLPWASIGCSSASAHSPFSVSVTVQEDGMTGPRPLLEKSVQSGWYTQIKGFTPFRHEKRPSMTDVDLGKLESILPREPYLDSPYRLYLYP